jgi:hypothetical protein
VVGFGWPLYLGCITILDQDGRIWYDGLYPSAPSVQESLTTMPKPECQREKVLDDAGPERQLWTIDSGSLTVTR